MINSPGILDRNQTIVGSKILMLSPPPSAVHMYYEKRRGVLISTLELTSAEIPKAFDGYRIVHLSDLHYGPATGLSHLEKVFSLSNDLNPDIVALNGDLLQLSAFGFREYFAKRVGPQAVKWTVYRRLVRQAAKKLATALLMLDAPDGVIGTFGNHDYYEGIFTIRRQITIEWLKNQAFVVQRGESDLIIAGIDDWRQGQPDLQKATRGRKPDIVLSHNPDIILDPTSQLLHSAKLILCGHTHGGQVRIPGLPPLLTRTKQKHFYQGLGYFENKTPIYVSNGVGYGVIPLRTFCPPEIVCIQLRSP